jgi:hypothetical protein
MKDKATLRIKSLLSILFFTFHWVDDIVRALAPGGVSGLGGVLTLVVWLYGTLLGSIFGSGLLERRSPASSMAAEEGA